MKHLIHVFALLFFTVVFVSCKKSDNAPAPTPAPVLANVTTASGVVGGPKNTVITVKGSNFITDLSKITITVNGKVCTILTATADSITARIPAYCGTGNVVINLNGTILNGPVFNYVYSYTLTSINTGQVGYQDGPMATAKWNETSGLCVDTSGNIFTSEWNKPVVRKITADFLNVSTLAGNTTIGDVNGQGTNAILSPADNISIDANGTIYYADQNNGKVKKIDKLGNVTTFIPASANFSPYTAQIAKSGNLYVLGQDQSISKYNAAGVLQWKIKSHNVSGSVDGDSSIVVFNQITFGNATIDDTEQYLYFSTYNVFGAPGTPSQIKKINLSTLITTTIAGVENVAGSTDGPAATATFKLITGMAIDKQGGIYISDGHNDKIRYLKAGIVSTIVGAAGSGDVDGDLSVAKIDYPDGLVLDKNGNLIVACVANNKIKRLIID